MNSPQLIENNASSHLQQILHKCHVNRVNFYYYILNISVLLLFVIVVGFILYYCYTRKPTEYEKQQKLVRDQEFVASKIRYYQENVKQKREHHSSNITDLPFIQT
jgi:hypothetical protein